MRASSWGLLFMRARHGGLGRLLASWARPLSRVGLTMADQGRGSLSDSGKGLLILALDPQGHPLDFASLRRRFSGATTPTRTLANRRAEGEVLRAETETCSANSQALHCNFLPSECFSRTSALVSGCKINNFIAGNQGCG